MTIINKNTAFALILLVTVAGCGRNDLQPLSGTVTFNGEPLGVGSIQFISSESTGIEASAPPAMAGIKDGQFNIPKAHGLKQGSYSVTITGYEGIRRSELMPLGLALFPNHTTTFEYTGQKTAEFDVKAVPRKLPPADQQFQDPTQGVAQ